MRPLISDAARPMKRALHLETLKLLDGEHTMFDLRVPAPAVLRSAIARQFQVKQHVIGAPAKHGIAVVLTFEVDPDEAPIARRYYALPYGVTVPNGAPVAIYSMPTPANNGINGTRVL